MQRRSRTRVVALARALRKSAGTSATAIAIEIGREIAIEIKGRSVSHGVTTVTKAGIATVTIGVIEIEMIGAREIVTIDATIVTRARPVVS